MQMDRKFSALLSNYERAGESESKSETQRPWIENAAWTASRLRMWLKMWVNLTEDTFCWGKKKIIVYVTTFEG